MSSYKPDGFTAVSPYLIVDGAKDTIAFLEKVLGAKVNDLHEHEGRIVHASLELDDSIIMLSDGAEGWPPRPAHVHVYVADVDATYRKALEAGAESVQEPVKRDDPDKRGGVKDAGGTTWWLATHGA